MHFPERCLRGSSPLSAPSGNQGAGSHHAVSWETANSSALHTTAPFSGQGWAATSTYQVQVPEVMPCPVCAAESRAHVSLFLPPVFQSFFLLLVRSLGLSQQGTGPTRRCHLVLQVFSCSEPALPLVSLVFDHSISLSAQPLSLYPCFFFPLCTSWLPFSHWPLLSKHCCRWMSRQSEEHRGCWKMVKQRADTWQNATAERFPVESAVAWNGLGPRAWGLLFSVPCWLNSVRSPSWLHLSIPVELSLC